MSDFFKIFRSNLLRAGNSQAFVASGNAASLAGNFSSVGLYNPAANSKTLYVNRIIGACGNTNTSVLLENVSEASWQAPIATIPGVNRYLNAAAALASVRTVQNAAPPTSQWTRSYPAGSAGSELLICAPGFGFVIPSGSALIIRSAGATTAITAWFEWIEK